MRLMTKPWAIATLSLFTLTGVGAALAQEETKPDAADAPQPVSGGQDVNLSPQAMLAQAQAMIPQMDKMRAGIQQQLTDAKNKKDVVKSLCLDDKIKQLKVATDTAKERVVGLTSAVSQNDPDRSKHEFTVVQVLNARAKALVAEAQQCIGEETGFVGNQDVLVEIDPNIPGADETDFPEDSLVTEPPLVASPLM